MTERVYLGIDVGTGSARAGLFDGSGKRLGSASEEIRIWRPEADHVEQSSEDIWRACGVACRAALAEAGLDPASIAGIGFDATCSLVVLDAEGAPLTVSRTGRAEQNVIVWMDHRAIAQAEHINEQGHEVLQYVGGRISPEMETPKLLWLKQQLPDTWKRAGAFFDLPDWLGYRATGSSTRSLCTTVCKWTYLGHEGEGGSWSDSYFEQVGLGDLVTEKYARIGTRVRPMGEQLGVLTEAAAQELGLVPGIPVAVGIIDAHAGGLGLLGVALDDEATTSEALERRVALIGGTSSCHMAVSREPQYVPGIWGPYYSAMVPGLWLTEGGQSATGALIDHTIDAHARGAELRQRAKDSNTSTYELLNQRLAELAQACSTPAELTRDLHVLPYHHGNRSPRSDPTLRGGVSGLRMSDSLDQLALLYLATVQAIAYGTRHILETMNEQAYAIDTIVACGGDTKNPVFLREHADASGCRIVLPAEPEAVLLGSALLGAVAAGDFASIEAAMQALVKPARIIEPSTEAKRYHDRKYRVFQRMYDDQLAYRELMQS